MIKRLMIQCMVMMVLVFGLGPVSAAPPQASLTEAEVRQFVAELDSAAKRRDHASMRRMFAPDATIRVHVDDSVQHYSREDYFQMMQKGAPESLSVNYSSKVNAVQVKGSRALVELTVTESVNTMMYGTLSSTAREVALLEKRGGRLMVTQLIAQMDWQQKF